jgi:uncharacterized membrane protein YgcG
MVAMRASWRKGLSGAVSAIVIAVVLVAGLASASYINLTAARYNEAQMQEALRQARLGSELIRIHIHSTDGAVDSPPRITFVNAWGYESRIIQLVIIGRETSGGSGGGGGGNNGGGGRRCHIVDGILECEIGEDGNTGGSTGGYTRTSTGGGQSQTQVIATIDLRDRPIVLPPGARLTIDPAQIGLSYPTFKRMADEIRSVFAYTEAGNSFGSTWGFPREDNLAGRTVATTVTGTTYEVWNVPSFTTINNSYRVVSYTTLGAIPNATTATIKAVNLFEKAVVVPEVAFEDPNRAAVTTYSWVSDVSQDAYGAFPRVNPAIPDSSFRPVEWRVNELKCWDLRRYYSGGLWQWSGDNCHTYGNPGERWYWYVTPGWMNLTGPTEYVEAGVHQAIINTPAKYRLVITIQPNGWSSYIQFTIDYRLGWVVIRPPIGINVQESVTTRRGMVVYATVQTHYLTSTEVRYRQQCWYDWWNDYWYCNWVPYTTYTHYIPAPGGAKTVTAYNPLTMRLYRTNNPYPPGSSGAILMTAIPTAPTTLTAYIAGTTCYYRDLWSGWICTEDPYRVGSYFTPYQAYVQPINQLLPENRLGAIYAIIPPGDYTVERYYYIDSVQYQVFSPPPPPQLISMDSSCPTCPVPRWEVCRVELVYGQSGSSSGGGGSGGGMSSGGAAGAILLKAIANCGGR